MVKIYKGLHCIIINYRRNSDVDNMYKMKREEYVYLHALLAQVKNYCINELDADEDDFSKYNGLDITPFQVLRRKEDHKEAIFVLCTELKSIFYNMSEKKKRAELDSDIRNSLGI